jgi:hypothetical protein
MAKDLQIAVYMKPSDGVALGLDLPGKGIGADSCCPDDRRRVDAFSRCEGDSVRVNGDDARSKTGLDAELGKRLLDDRPGARPEIGTDGIVPFDDHHTDVGISPERGAQAMRHFGSRLDPGESSTCHDHEIAGGRFREIRQFKKMFF